MIFAKWFFPEAVFRINSHVRILFLTFDDGPDPEVTPVVINILSKYNVKAVFFCKGTNAEKYPGIVNTLKNNGHIIGNHGYQHLKGWATNSEQYVNNVIRAEQFSSDLLFRPPYGRITFKQYRLLKRKYKIIFWDLMPFDFDPNIKASECFRILKHNLRPGSVIVLHDNNRSSVVEYLDDFINYSINSGYKFELLPF